VWPKPRNAAKRWLPAVRTSPSAIDEALAAGCDFVVAGEGEQTLSLLVEALDKGQTGGVIQASGTTDIATAPLPRLDLINHADYDAMPVQTSRGCPFACEFCDVINLFGRVPRYKPAEQILDELEAIFAAGYRGSIFITDDNFIGNPDRAETLLKVLAPWNHEHGEPFWFTTQASINLGERPDLIDLMTAANFGYVFIGIESPDVNVLAGAHKTQNTRFPLLEAIHTINRNGLSVIGSFILGFDREKEGAGERIEAFVEAAGIPLVMINSLQAVPGTKLWDRLTAEGRIVAGDVGDMATGVMNFRPDRPVTDIFDRTTRGLGSSLRAVPVPQKDAAFHAGNAAHPVGHGGKDPADGGQTGLIQRRSGRRPGAVAASGQAHLAFRPRLPRPAGILEITLDHPAAQSLAHQAFSDPARHGLRRPVLHQSHP